MNEGTSALQIVPEHQAALFDTSKPDLVIDKAKGIATKLTDIVEQARLYSMISNRKYVKVEGWTTMLAMLGVFPHVEYCRRVYDEHTPENTTLYEARVVLKTIEGRDVGSGEALCSSVERNWSNRDEFAIKSMAQTRATGKAARNAFSWIMALAGYEATPAEEMNGDEHTSRGTQPTKTRQNVPQEAVDGSGDFLTECFKVSEPYKNRKQKVYWKAMDRNQKTYFVWDDKVCADLSVANGALVTVELQTNNGFTKIARVIGGSSEQAQAAELPK